MSTSTADTNLPLNTIQVPHLNGTIVSYLVANGPITSSKPTLVFINGYMGSAHRFRAQIHDPQLAEVATLLAVEPLGHGGTSTTTPAYTLWDAAWAISQALDALNVKKYVVCGTSSGGFIAARLALYAPENVLGLVMIGSSLDIDQGAEAKILQPVMALTAKYNPDFQLPSELINAVHGVSLGTSAAPGAREHATTIANDTYSGESGRIKLRQATTMLLSRDSLNIRAPDLKMPILWIQGSEDQILSPEKARLELALTGSVDPQFEVVQGGHYSSHVTHPEVVNALLKEFVAKHGA